ncbi:hypothetical protein ACNAW0_21765 [Micromonospora sp. SL1-18]|uniref:hypothetical protein n=1 Tax=Micromonospora sp. SL1-18 TaxID=3399128 RepID=UPI003A4DA993
MAVMWPLWTGDLKSGLPSRRPADRRVLLRNWLFGLAAVSLVVAVGLVGWQFARLAAPTVVRWQISVIDANSDAPPRPHLPASPFAR